MIRILSIVLLLISFGAAQAAGLPTQKVLTLEAAKKMLAAAEVTANKNNFKVVMCVLDEGGHLIALTKIDETQNGCIDLAIMKARAAVNFKGATKLAAEALDKGKLRVLKFPDSMPVEGGIPIIVDGRVIGAIGVSGAEPEEDGMVAKAGIDGAKDLLK
ncbi:MAG: heme-binding protein [Pseudomonadota bacterium]|nr:heme-binding protein [Pseudomonadota bacterium]